MKRLVSTIDELLRDRSALYQVAREGKQLPALCVKLLVVFLLTSAIYGGVMGAFRAFHREFYFSDFEITATEGEPVRGEVAGMTADYRVVYTRVPLATVVPGSTIRFNLTNPTDAYQVTEVGEEKGYRKIVLAEGAVLQETQPWLIPLLVAMKIPLLFLLTLAVCALALYILNLAFGLQLRFVPSMTLMLFALAGTGVMLVVFAPISLLFTVVTSSYHFMKIMHVLVFTVAGLFGVKILSEGLARMQAPAEGEETLQVRKARARPLLFCWLLLYCLVGAQLAWSLKPFLGTPYLPATPPFRLEKGNIFVSTIESWRVMGPSEW